VAADARPEARSELQQVYGDPILSLLFECCFFFFREQESVQAWSRGVSEDFDWASHCECVADVGGGRGHQLFEILMTHPSIKRGVVVDLPDVIDEAIAAVSSKNNGPIDAKISFIKVSSFV
jgi:hypothetical protein